ncbi:hypothetical protein WN51_11565 [Melipona quadrifasciata]|uniref:Uncharacterized protein n=1 Tax=Melipona quadrifasciata TaxID=166423 RepID=A0A0M9A4E0_9HYME|nr:hypothetical protein WN51_11565 [Melipona quadrifasciata]
MSNIHSDSKRTESVYLCQKILTCWNGVLRINVKRVRISEISIAEASEVYLWRRFKNTIHELYQRKKFRGDILYNPYVIQSQYMVFPKIFPTFDERYASLKLNGRLFRTRGIQQVDLILSFLHQLHTSKYPALFDLSVLSLRNEHLRIVRKCISFRKTSLSFGLSVREGLVFSRRLFSALDSNMFQLNFAQITRHLLCRGDTVQVNIMSKQESKGPPPPPLPPPYSHQKLFKKCKSATFQLDGATYTIEIKETNIPMFVFLLDIASLVEWLLIKNCTTCTPVPFVSLKGPEVSEINFSAKYNAFSQVEI